MTLTTSSGKIAMLGAVAGAAIALAGPGSASSLLDFTEQTTINEITGSGGGTAFAGTGFETGYTVTATGGTLSTNVPFDGGACPAPLACDGDGLGVDNDEITGLIGIATGESITITFDKSVRLATLFLLDLFIGQQAETATYAINGGAGTTVSATATNNSQGGFLAVDLGGQSVQSITFTAQQIFGDDGSNDFAVAALQAVPLPPAVLMLLSSLCGFALLGRRRRAHA